MNDAVRSLLEAELNRRRSDAKRMEGSIDQLQETLRRDRATLLELEAYIRDLEEDLAVEAVPA